jgi:hypothetical protein
MHGGHGMACSEGSKSMHSRWCRKGGVAAGEGSIYSKVVQLSDDTVRIWEKRRMPVDEGKEVVRRAVRMRGRGAPGQRSRAPTEHRAPSIKHPPSTEH